MYTRCQLLAEKEKLLNRIMLVLNEQEEIEEKIAKQVPVIARKSTREKPQKRKRTGFLGLFGKKEEAKPTATTLRPHLGARIDASFTKSYE